jgi:hypothetical protein
LRQAPCFQYIHKPIHNDRNAEPHPPADLREPSSSVSVERLPAAPAGS